MWIKDLWNRVLAKFRKEDSMAEPVMELKPQEAPEPVPERKTSDEMIVEMAESAAQGGDETVLRSDPALSGEKAEAEQVPEAGPAPESPEQGAETETFRDPVYWEADTDPVDTECEAESDESKDTEKEC